MGLPIDPELSYGLDRAGGGGSWRFAAPRAGEEELAATRIALIVIVGLVKSRVHRFHALPPVPRRPVEAAGILLVLLAFASGATAMTGIEVISNACGDYAPRALLHLGDRLAFSSGIALLAAPAVIL